MRNEMPGHSDHRPVVVDTADPGGGRPGQRREFHFEARWSREEGCQEVVEEAWRKGRELGVER